MKAGDLSSPVEAAITRSAPAMRSNAVGAKRRRLLPWAFCGAFLICVNAPAAMVSLATSTLVDGAACIVEGRIAELSSRWTDDRSGIVTEVVVDAREVLLGDTNRIAFFYPGGGVGELEQRVSDMPALTQGQEILVFLRAPIREEAQRDPSAGLRGVRYTLMGAAQGVYRIEEGRAIKEGFTVVDDSAVIDRRLDARALKALVRDRLAETGRMGNGP